MHVSATFLPAKFANKACCNGKPFVTVGATLLSQSALGGTRDAPHPHHPRTSSGDMLVPRSAPPPGALFADGGSPFVAVMKDAIEDAGSRFGRAGSSCASRLPLVSNTAAGVASCAACGAALLASGCAGFKKRAMPASAGRLGWGSAAAEASASAAAALEAGWASSGSDAAVLGGWRLESGGRGRPNMAATDTWPDFRFAGCVAVCAVACSATAGPLSLASAALMSRAEGRASSESVSY